MLGSFGATEILLLLLLVVILFGAAKIPLLGKGLGEGIRNFKSAMRGKENSGEPPEPK